MKIRRLTLLTTAGALLALQAMVGCEHHGLSTPRGTGGSGAGGVEGVGGSTSNGGAPGTGGTVGSGGTIAASTQTDAALPLDDGLVDSGLGASLTVSPVSAAFWVPSGDMGPIVFSVSNGGSAPSGMFAITIDGADADRFEISSNSCDRPLPPGECCQVAVAFKHTYGSYIAFLTIVAEGFPGGKASVWLTGNED